MTGDLVSEAVYLLQQPKVQDDPVAHALAIHTGEILGRISLTKDAFLAEEVRLNLQQLWNKVVKAMTQQVALDSRVPPGPLLYLQSCS